MSDAGFQNDVRNQSLGSWTAFPNDLFKLLQYKKITHIEFCTLHYIFCTLYRKNKYSGNFSLRHLEEKVSVNRKTVIKSIRKFESLGFIFRHFDHSFYGETYTLSLKHLGLILDELEGGVSSTPLLESNTPLSERNTPLSESNTPLSERNTPNNRFIYNNIYSLYNKKLLAGCESLEIEFQRLIDVGFSVENLMSFLELHSKNGYFDFESIQSFYAVVTKYGKKNLEQIEKAMTAKRLRRIDENKKVQAHIENIRNGKVKSNTKIIKRSDGKPSFKLNT